MTARDLRSFLEATEAHSSREFLRIPSAVSPDWEIAAILAKLESKMRVPVLEFSRVEGTTLPVVVNVCASPARIARDLGITASELETRLADAYDAPLPPTAWSDTATPPVRERTYRGDELDLTRLPRFRHTEHERSRYLSGAVVVARHPETGVQNASFHRLMTIDRSRMAIFMTPGGHLHHIFEANRDAGRSTPVAAFIGAHPLWSLGCLATDPDGALDEFEIVGALLGEPLEVTPGLVDGALRIPARAEIAIEGILAHDETVPEGPYGEFAGYVARERPAPVFVAHAMTTRAEPILQEIVAGRIEHLTMSGLAIRAHLKRRMADRYPEVLEFHLPAPMTLYLRVDTSAMSVEGRREMLERVLREERFVKQVICLDADIAIRNHQHVQWALATRVQADRDVIVLSGCLGNGVDPSEHDGLTTKWGIDATASPTLDAFPPKNRVPRDVIERIDLEKLTEP